MITYLSNDEVVKFVNRYKTNRYRNITVGTEGSSFFIKNYYKIMDLPFAALYDKNGNIQCSYQKNIPLNEFAKRLQKLK